MGKMLCECGYIHSDTCGYDGDLFKYNEWIVIDQEDIEYLSVFECPKCGNLMIEDPKNPKIMITYRPFNSIYNRILHDKNDKSLRPSKTYYEGTENLKKDKMPSSHWSQTEQGKKQLLNIVNEKFFFLKDGTPLRRDEFCDKCKNELVACVC